MSVETVTNPTQERIIRSVCEYFEITEEQLINNSTYDFVEARWLYFYLTKKNTNLSVKAIGQRVRKDRPAVRNGLDNIEVRKRIYVQTVSDLKKIAEKAGISEI